MQFYEGAISETAVFASNCDMLLVDAAVDGTDVAVEALRDCWRHRKATMDKIQRCARIDRVANVMRPYIESLV